MAKRMHGGLVAGAAVLALAALGAGLLAGCGSGEPAEQSSPRTIAVSPTAPSGTTVDAAVGDMVVVSLVANATTGYEWQFTAGDTFTIEKSEYVPDPNPDGLAGSGGTQVVTLKVTEAGTSDLTGVYVRPWETPSPSPEAETTVTIVSE
jgi:predicted secreted protein